MTEIIDPAKLLRFIGATEARLDGFDREFEQLRRELVASEGRMKSAINGMNIRTSAKSVSIGAGGGTVAFVLFEIAKSIIAGG